VILLTAFSFLGMQNLKEMNGLKNLVSAILTSIAVCIYIIGGKIEWLPALIMGISAATGGYIGASISYKIADKWGYLGHYWDWFHLIYLLYLKRHTRMRVSFL